MSPTDPQNPQLGNGRPEGTPAEGGQPAQVGAPARVVTGHYGSGKSEFCVSLAMHLAAGGRRVALADLDIVNPYFRSREKADLLEAHGVHVISSMLGHNTTIEIPAISPEVRTPLHDRTVDPILDMGGDSVGAKILAQFRADIVRRGFELLFVVNAYRPETARVDQVVDYLGQIQSVAGLRASALISNTHLLRETSTDDVRAGLELCRQASERTGLPIRYVSAIPDALSGLTDADLRQSDRVLQASGAPDDKTDAAASAPIEKLPVGMYLRDEWM